MDQIQIPVAILVEKSEGKDSSEIFYNFFDKYFEIEKLFDIEENYIHSGIPFNISIIIPELDINFNPVICSGKELGKIKTKNYSYIGELTDGEESGKGIIYYTNGDVSMRDAEKTTAIKICKQYMLYIKREKMYIKYCNGDIYIGLSNYYPCYKNKLFSPSEYNSYKGVLYIKSIDDLFNFTLIYKGKFSVSNDDFINISFEGSIIKNDTIIKNVFKRIIIMEKDIPSIDSSSLPFENIPSINSMNKCCFIM